LDLGRPSPMADIIFSKPAIFKNLLSIMPFGLGPWFDFLGDTVVVLGLLPVLQPGALFMVFYRPRFLFFVPMCGP